MKAWTLIFANSELENQYQRKRTSANTFPCFGKLLLLATLLGGIARRAQLLYESYYASKQGDSSEELRLSIIYFSGLLVEGCTSCIPVFRKLRGVPFIITCIWHLIDSSAFYYPDNFALVPT